MSEPVRLEISAAGHAGHVFASREMAGRSVPSGPPSCSSTESARHTATCAGYTGSWPRRRTPTPLTCRDSAPRPRPRTRSPLPTTPATSSAPWNSWAYRNSCSWGTRWEHRFATEAALQQPERISNLVLMGPVVDPRRGTVAQQALALGRDCLFYESPSSNALVFTDYLRCGPVLVPQDPAGHDGVPHGTEDRRRQRAGPRGARRQRPRRGCGLVPPAGRARQPRAAAGSAGNRACRPAQPGPRSAGRRFWRSRALARRRASRCRETRPDRTGCSGRG